MSGQVLRVDGNTVSRVKSWEVAEAYTSRSGEALTAEEVGTGIRKMMGALPRGLGA